MSGGVVEGGWEFVQAAYTLTALVLVSYGTSLIMRLREANKKKPRETSGPGGSCAMGSRVRSWFGMPRSLGC